MKIKEKTKVKVVSNTSGHNYRLGEVYITIRINNGMWILGNLKTPNVACGNNCYPNDLKVVYDNKNELLKTAVNLENDLQIIKEKIEFMTIHKLKEFDEKTFKSHKALEFMKDEKRSDKEKLEFFKELM